jgi:hypothetical protein
MLTAAGVFVVGMVVLPSVEPEPAPVPAAPPPAPEPPPPPPPPPPAAPVDAATVVDAGIAAPEPPKPAKEPPKEAAKAPDKEPAAAPAASIPTPAKSDAASKGPDKDVAREAWRKNLPDVSAEAGKAAILIPIKGSIEGAVFHVSPKPRFVLVTLPKAEPMITMPFYSIKRDGFRQLWLSKDKESGAATIKVNLLGEASDPQVEIKDEFVRVTVRRPAEAAAPAAAAPAPAPAAEPTAGEPTPPAPAPPAPAHD